ncbi:alpha beta hydrolase fold-3 domain-containing protein [Colletotrichum truncatum]|uniref:Alpha beta hydrolase fold-3 domain-containing protein n=1 Tax=Colletotrichum truncatum TaxID=5467 RepID=A0ACC3Z8R7_COLTU|nr:alpha beta hydrolase fold-3 domain-containing protein [Colletotrichum truncatum]KAF6789306.1 alpha beta hydrolase fold-3 domain-containing protein [Colletotrichum truncatum]
MASSSVNQLPRPPYDPQLVSLIGNAPPYPRSRDEVVEGRQVRAKNMASLEASMRNDKDLMFEDRRIPGPACDIPLIILQSNNPKTPTRQRPAVLFLHGGGMVVGNGFLGLEFYCQVAKELDAVIISVEYRLAPEHPAPAPQDDCFAALKWVAENVAVLGIDASRLMIAGVSAGGGLAAGVALKARDAGGPKLCAQLLTYPMLDDRDKTVSKRQFLREEGLYDSTDNNFAWSCVLGDKQGSSEGVDYYVAPARATDLSGLPPAYIDVGTADPFRDEDVAYATKLCECGVQTDLHMWSGGYHGFDILGLPVGAGIAKAAIETRMGWVRRILCQE